MNGNVGRPNEPNLSDMMVMLQNFMGQVTEIKVELLDNNDKLRGQMEQRFEQIEQRITEKMGNLKTDFERNINNLKESMTKRVDGVEGRVEDGEQNVKKLEIELNQVKQEVQLCNELQKTVYK